MKLQEVREAIIRLRMAKEALDIELYDNDGEVTESVLDKQRYIADVKSILENGGIDHLGRLIKSVETDIQNRKNEKAYVERQIKRSESFKENLLELANTALEELQQEKIKGDFGYSFTAHTSVTTKPNNKLIKELYYEKAEKVLRESGVVPKDITFSLSASVSLLDENEKKPEWYNISEVGKATFRSPKKDTSADEFSTTDFE